MMKRRRTGNRSLILLEPTKTQLYCETALAAVAQVEYKVDMQVLRAII